MLALVLGACEGAPQQPYLDAAPADAWFDDAIPPGSAALHVTWLVRYDGRPGSCGRAGATTVRLTSVDGDGGVTVDEFVCGRLEGRSSPLPLGPYQETLGVYDLDGGLLGEYPARAITLTRSQVVEYLGEFKWLFPGDLPP